MYSLLAALATPIAGASLYRLLHDQPRLTRAFDIFMYIAVPLLVFWQIFGHVIEHHGWDVIYLLILFGIMALGFGLPITIEHLSHRTTHSVKVISVLAGFSGLALHAILEGISLQGETITITAPLLLHRIMVGLMLWWVLFPRYGRIPAVIGIAGLLAATTVGYFLAGLLPEAALSGTSGEFFQAFVAGALLHVVLHKNHNGNPHSHGPKSG